MIWIWAWCAAFLLLLCSWSACPSIPILAPCLRLGNPPRVVGTPPALGSGGARSSHKGLSPTGDCSHAHAAAPQAEGSGAVGPCWCFLGNGGTAPLLSQASVENTERIAPTNDFPVKKWNGTGVDLGYRSLSSQSFLCYFFINLAASRLPSNNSLKAHFPCITLCKHKVEKRVFRLILQECCFWENACLPMSVIFKNIMCIRRSKIITCENSSISIRSKLWQNCIFNTPPCRLTL